MLLVSTTRSGLIPEHCKPPPGRDTPLPPLAATATQAERRCSLGQMAVGTGDSPAGTPGKHRPSLHHVRPTARLVPPPTQEASITFKCLLLQAGFSVFATVNALTNHRVALALSLDTTTAALRHIVALQTECNKKA